MQSPRRKVALFATVLLIAGTAFAAAGCKKEDTAEATPPATTTAAPGSAAASSIPPDVQQKVDAYAREAQARNAANAEARKKAMEAHGIK